MINSIDTFKSSYIKTKLNIPSISNDIVLRKNILKRLDTSLTKKLITISAPAGFGKTTSIIDWLWKNKIPFSWLSLSESDNLSKTFITYIVRAINLTYPEWGNTIIPILENSEKINLQYISELIINEIEQSNKDFYLILDDFHLVENKEIEDFLEKLLKHTRDNFHLYLLSRYQVKLSLIPKYRLENKLLEININDFKFQTDEIKSLFFNNNYKIENDLAQIIHEKTEGWILCIKMILASIENEYELETYIKNFSGKDKNIFDYFFFEVINNLDENYKLFLLKTSLVNKFNPEIAKYLTGFDNIYEIISTIENKNLFLISLDKYREWYRYHYFFQDSLQEYFKRINFTLFKETHKKVYKWLYENDYFSEALFHAIKTDDLDFIFESVENICFESLLKGQKILSTVVEKIPEDITKKSVFLYIYKAWMTASDFQVDFSEKYIKSANTLFENYDEEKQEYIKFFITNVQVIISAKQNNIFLIFKYANKLKKSKIGLQPYWLASIYSHIGFAHIINLDFDKAIKNLNKAVFYFQKSNNITSMISTKSFIARVFFLLGELHKAEKIFLEIIKISENYNLEKHPDLLSIFTDLASIYSYYCDKDKVYEYLQKLNNLKLEKFSSSLSYFYIMSITIKFNFWDFENLKNLIDEFEEIIINKNISSYLDILNSFKLKFDIFNGNFSKAKNWAIDFIERFEKIYSTPEMLNMDQIIHLYNELSTLIQFFMFEKKYQNILYFIDKILPLSEKFNIISITIDLEIKKAIILKILGKDKLAQDLFIKSLELSQNNDFISPYAYEYEIEIIKILINDTLNKKDININIKNFIKKINIAIQNRETEINKRLTLFSPKEKQVISLLLKKFSNEQICKELNLSINTIKSHIKHIYKKLNIKTRKELINLNLNKGEFLI